MSSDAENLYRAMWSETRHGIDCDQCGDGDVCSSHTETEAVDQWIDDGWRYVGGYVLCPECACDPKITDEADDESD